MYEGTRGAEPRCTAYRGFFPCTCQSSSSSSSPPLFLSSTTTKMLLTTFQDDARDDDIDEGGAPLRVVAAAAAALQPASLAFHTLTDHHHSHSLPVWISPNWHRSLSLLFLFSSSSSKPIQHVWNKARVFHVITFGPVSHSGRSGTLVQHHQPLSL